MEGIVFRKKLSGSIAKASAAQGVIERHWQPSLLIAPLVRLPPPF